MPIFTAIERPTGIVTITDEGEPILRVDIRLGGIGEVRFLNALIWAANNLRQDVINRAIVDLGTADETAVSEYLLRKKELEKTHIRDILGNL